MQVFKYSYWFQSVCLHHFICWTRTLMCQNVIIVFLSGFSKTLVPHQKTEKKTTRHFPSAPAARFVLMKWRYVVNMLIFNVSISVWVWELPWLQTHLSDFMEFLPLTCVSLVDVIKRGIHLHTEHFAGPPPWFVAWAGQNLATRGTRERRRRCFPRGWVQAGHQD